MKPWGGVIGFSTAALPHQGDVDVGGPGLTTSDVVNQTDLAWAGENAYDNEPGTAAGRGAGASSLNYGGGPILNPNQIDSPAGDPVVWGVVVIVGGIVYLYHTHGKEKGVFWEIVDETVKVFIGFFVLKTTFTKIQFSGVSEVVQFVV